MEVRVFEQASRECVWMKGKSNDFVNTVERNWPCTRTVGKLYIATVILVHTKPSNSILVSSEADTNNKCLVLFGK